MCPRHDQSFCAFTTAWLAPELLGSIGPSPHLWFLHAKQRLLDQSTSLLGYQTSPVVLCMQNSVICTRIKRLYGFQLSPVVLCMQNSDFRTRITSLCRWIDPACGFCMQNSDFWTRITSLYWSQTSPVVLCSQYSVINTWNTCLYGSQPLSVVFACITATFGPECKFSMGSSPHLSFLHAKQRLLDQINKSLWVPDMTYHFVHIQQRA